MSRSVPEWRGKTDDTPVPPRVRLRVFDRFGGGCQCCGRKILSGEQWQCDHIVALINGGEHRESNLQPLLTEHHKNKTRADVAEKAHSYRRRLRNASIRKPSRFPASKDSNWKRKVSGEVVRR